MRMAEIVDAIFQKDAQAVRAAFDFLVSTTDVLRLSVIGTVEEALVVELCVFLAQDEAVMQESLCEELSLPISSSFSQGVIKVAEVCLRKYKPSSARSDY